MPEHALPAATGRGVEDMSHRREASPVVLLRLLSVDYVVDHPALPWLPTEAEEVAARAAPGASKPPLPSRPYQGPRGSRGRRSRMPERGFRRARSPFPSFVSNRKRGRRPRAGTTGTKGRCGMNDRDGNGVEERVPVRVAICDSSTRRSRRCSGQGAAGLGPSQGPFLADRKQTSEGRA